MGDQQWYLFCSIVIIESLLHAAARYIIQYFNLASCIAIYIVHKDVNMMMYNRLIRLPHNAIHSPNIIIYREDCRLGLYDEDYGD